MSDLAIYPLSEEHRMLRDAARDFAQKEIAPIAAQFDESGEFPYETIRKMGAMGFMGIEVPEEYGGAGMDTLAYVLAVEEISKPMPRTASSCRSTTRSTVTAFSNSAPKRKRRSSSRRLLPGKAVGAIP